MKITRLLNRASGIFRAADDGAEADAAKGARRPGAPRVLCIDDNPSILKMLSRVLSGEFDVVLASGPDEGMEALDAGEPFDVIISDLRMPGVEGVTFLNQLRDIAPDTERLILSGWTDPVTTAVAKGGGRATRFIPKPVHPDDLLAAVADAVRRRAAARAGETKH